jgi:hypothetical protein
VLKPIEMIRTLLLRLDELRIERSVLDVQPSKILFSYMAISCCSQKVTQQPLGSFWTLMLGNHREKSRSFGHFNRVRLKD